MKKHIATKILHGVHGTTMVEVIDPIHNQINDFFRLFSAWGDRGQFYMYDENRQCFQIECSKEFYELAKTPEFTNAFFRLGLDVEFV